MFVPRDDVVPVAAAHHLRVARLVRIDRRCGLVVNRHRLAFQAFRGAAIGHPAAGRRNIGLKLQRAVLELAVNYFTDGVRSADSTTRRGQGRNYCTASM
jgi:hypothetical protein